MPIRDTFPHTARWDSVGLDCSDCVHFAGPPSWPDVERMSRCTLHRLSLAVELGPNGYKEGEWFCRDFAARALQERGLLHRLFGRSGTHTRASPDAVRHLNGIKPELQPHVLYGFHGEDGNLKECPFAQLREPR
ncbi:MAG TPA: hypothetical protein VGU27_01880 [Candidatus Eisenbacteria bacterium]|nr:hypothetical protein [Candidatus Eisenbacteria bacterium]